MGEEEEEEEAVINDCGTPSSLLPPLVAAFVRFYRMDIGRKTEKVSAAEEGGEGAVVRSAEQKSSSPPLFSILPKGKKRRKKRGEMLTRRYGEI